MRTAIMDSEASPVPNGTLFNFYEIYTHSRIPILGLTMTEVLLDTEDQVDGNETGNGGAGMSLPVEMEESWPAAEVREAYKIFFN